MPNGIGSRWNVGNITLSSSDIFNIEDLTGDLKQIRINIVDDRTKEPIEPVDVLTSAKAVLIDRKDNLNIKDYVDNNIKYSNSTPLPDDVGSFKKGKTFDDVPIKTIINGILYGESSGGSTPTPTEEKLTVYTNMEDDPYQRTNNPDTLNKVSIFNPYTLILKAVVTDKSKIINTCKVNIYNNSDLWKSITLTNVDASTNKYSKYIKYLKEDIDTDFDSCTYTKIPSGDIKIESEITYADSQVIWSKKKSIKFEAPIIVSLLEKSDNSNKYGKILNNATFIDTIKNKFRNPSTTNNTYYCYPDSNGVYKIHFTKSNRCIVVFGIPFNKTIKSIKDNSGNSISNIFVNKLYSGENNTESSIQSINRISNIDSNNYEKYNVYYTYPILSRPVKTTYSDTDPVNVIDNSTAFVSVDKDSFIFIELNK